MHCYYLMKAVHLTKAVLSQDRLEIQHAVGALVLVTLTAWAHMLATIPLLV